jgi:hypothetical protein
MDYLRTFESLGSDAWSWVRQSWIAIAILVISVALSTGLNEGFTVAMTYMGHGIPLAHEARPTYPVQYPMYYPSGMKCHMDCCKQSGLRCGSGCLCTPYPNPRTWTPKPTF